VKSARYSPDASLVSHKHNHFSVVAVDDAALWAGEMLRPLTVCLSDTHRLKLNFQLAPFTGNECMLGLGSFRHGNRHYRQWGGAMNQSCCSPVQLEWLRLGFRLHRLFTNLDLGENAMQLNQSDSTFRSIFEQTKSIYSNVCHNITFIDATHSPEKPESDLDNANIKFDEILKFTDKTVSSSDGYPVADADGFTINFIHAGTPASAIFLKSSAAGITESESPHIYWLIQTLFLHHELMHAQDLKLGKNFNLANRTVDLVKAEVYADVKTLRFFDDLRKHGGEPFRNMYATGILGREKSPIYTRIYNGIIKTFPQAKLRAWASQV